VGTRNETVTEYGIVGVAAIERHGPGTENVGHGTPGQFSRAAFFQRTFISSILYKAFLFSSIDSLSFVWLFIGIVTFELDCAKLKSGSKNNSKILNFILCFINYHLKFHSL
jgi:hypothetical protein